MSSHLDDSERLKGNKRNGRGSKRVKTMAGEIDIVTPQDRHSSFSPEILKKRETILADNMSSKIISLYGMGLSLRDISSHIEEMYDVEISHNTLSEIIERIVPKVKGVGDLNIIHLLDMGGNIPKAQTHTIQTDNLGRHVVRKNRLALFKDLRTKAAVTIFEESRYQSRRPWF